MTTQLQPVLQQVRKLVITRDSGCLTDGQLLDSFIAHRDEAAFQALVRRHGPMVLGVCRRVLRNPADVEDAFQATFLVLVRKAEAIVPREEVGNWLYGVARTTAIRANALIARQRHRERQVREFPDTEARPDERVIWNDLRLLLDQELGRLPDKYRIPIVLCDLESRSIKEAAHTLAWPQGTVAGRLARGRKMLASRLTRRGVSVSGATLVAVLTTDAASAHVPRGLMAASVGLVRLSPGPAAAGVLSAKALTLMEGAIKTMCWNKVKMMVLLLGVLGVGSGLGVCCWPTAAAKQPPAGSLAANTPTAPRRPGEDQRYRYFVETRLMAALKQPTTFHTEREVIEYPSMVFQANQSMKVWIGGARRDWSSSAVAPQDGELASALLFGLKQAPGNKVAVDITLQDEKSDGNTGKYTVLPGTVRHVAAEVTPGKIAKLPLPRLGNDEPRQWLEVMVRNFKFTAGFGMPPRRADVFTLHVDLTEIRGDGEKELASPMLQVIEGQTAQFSSVAQATGRHQGVPVSGLICSARIKKLHDGRLQLDMHLDRHAKRHEDNEALEAHTSTLHVIKVIQPNQKLDFQVEGTGKADHPIRVQLDVSQVKS